VSTQRFVLNEWILHDLRGDNGPKAQEESHRFLDKLKEKCDRIAVLIGSPWMGKAYELMWHTNPPIRTLSKHLHGILRDSRKCELLDQSRIKTLPEDLKGSVPPGDFYLVETYYSADAQVLVTTDQKLIQILSAAQNVNIRLRDEFLRKYLDDTESL